MKPILVITFLDSNDMPGSREIGKADIKKWIDKQGDIKVIVDIGCGSGTYPRLLGNRYEYIGIEIWEPYVAMFGLNDLYEELIISDVRLCSLPEGDCIIFGDILEHLPKEDALKLIIESGKGYKHMVISIPISESEGEITYGRIHYGNPNEEHKSAWTFEELMKMFIWENAILSRGMGIFIK